MNHRTALCFSNGVSSQDVKMSQVSINRGMDRKGHTHTHTHREKEEKFAICNNLDTLEGIMLSKISQSKINTV